MKIRVSGITCTNCAKTITNAVFAKYKEKVIVKVNVTTQEVFFNSSLNLERSDLISLLAQAGYPEVSSNKKTLTKAEYKLILSILLTIPLVLGMLSHFITFIPKIFINPWLQLILSSIIQFIIGKSFYKSAWHSLKQRVLGMDFLVVMGSSAAYIYSLLTIILKQNGILYFEVSAVVITIVLIGKYLEHRVKLKTTSALENLINLNVKEARLIDGNKISIFDVKEGDELSILAHESIPLDGIIIDGNTYVDQSSFTGENLPCAKKVGDFVYGATLNVGAKVIISVTKTYEHTRLASIIKSVEEASLASTQLQRIADKIASIFVPIVIIASLLTFSYYYITGALFNVALTHALAVILISCPCALGLATPTSIMVANGIAASLGILYKGGVFFEIAEKINVICFDKTKTLTIGVPTIANISLDDKYLPFLYACESQSIHPLSVAVANYCIKLNIPLIPVTKTEFMVGLGIKAEVNTDKITIGTLEFMHKENIEIPDNLMSLYQEYIKKKLTVNLIAINSIAVGMYGAHDPIKPDIAAIIQTLKDSGIEPFMLTGDNEATAQSVASSVGIDKIYSQLLPEDKANIVAKLQENGSIVAFVGDGINDAPALVKADVGISVAGGSDTAINASDVTLLNDDLSLINTGILIAKATTQNIKQNFFWALSYNIIAIPLAATGKLNMLVAACTMAFSSIVVVINALRLKNIKLPINMLNLSKSTLFIPNMKCKKCVNKITSTLHENQIFDFHADLTVKSLITSKSLEDKIIKLLIDVGFDVSLIQNKSS